MRLKQLIKDRTILIETRVDDIDAELQTIAVSQAATEARTKVVLQDAARIENVPMSKMRMTDRKAFHDKIKQIKASATHHPYVAILDSVLLKSATKLYRIWFEPGAAKTMKKLAAEWKKLQRELSRGKRAANKLNREKTEITIPKTKPKGLEVDPGNIDQQLATLAKTIWKLSRSLFHIDDIIVQYIKHNGIGSSFYEVPNVPLTTCRYVYKHISKLFVDPAINTIRNLNPYTRSIPKQMPHSEQYYERYTWIAEQLKVLVKQHDYLRRIKNAENSSKET